MNRTEREIRRVIASEGLVIMAENLGGTGHRKYRLRTKAGVEFNYSTGRSPSCKRHLKNMRRDLRRLIRGEIGWTGLSRSVER